MLREGLISDSVREDDDDDDDDDDADALWM